MIDREQQIRERAHEIWESEGRPVGRDREHWEMACREIGEPASAIRQHEESMEVPDPEVAARPPANGRDRPGADLGGASKENRKLGPRTTVPGGPKRGPVPGR